MTDTKLLPCPFCGGEATFEEVENRWSVGCNERSVDEEILCYGYQSLTTFATKREAVQAWNRRKDRDNIIEECCKVCESSIGEDYGETFAYEIREHFATKKSEGCG